jgi:L-lactate dehydrogenase complex protein LldG
LIRVICEIRVKKQNMSRENILAAIRQNQPSLTPLPSLEGLNQSTHNPLEQFKMVLRSIGGIAIEVTDYQAIELFIQQNYTRKNRIITTLPDLAKIAETDWQNDDPHDLENVELTIIKAHFGVAENAALWITEGLMGQRVAPFICQNLAIVLNKKDIVPTMHEAYKRIGASEYGFGSFIAGPSKTADIEQSLVLGAHGSKTMVVFLMT